MSTLLFLWWAGFVHVTHPCVVTVWSSHHREMDCSTAIEAEGLDWFMPTRTP